MTASVGLMKLILSQILGDNMRHGSYRLLLEKYSMEDIKNFHLDVPVEVLSNGACTPEGVLKKTAGMDAQQIKEYNKSNRR